MGSRNRSGPIPDRWLRCPRKSLSLLMNKFLIFKTPLCSKFDDQVPDEYRFPVDFIFSSMKSYKVKVGLWIDLTNTSRFYDKQAVEDNDCRYVKLHCKGRGETPAIDLTNTFISICDKFIRSNPLEIIGVHCTHGFNRSGFLIISYLVDNLCWGLDAALAEFSKVRPPGIYKKDYILELYKRYDSEEDAIEAPELPDWCLEFEGDDSDGEEQQEDSGTKRKDIDEDSEVVNNAGSGANKRRREMVKANPTFMEGVGGVEPITPPLLGEIQRKVQELCGWKRSGFPGSQPVSMDLENIRLLQEKPYRVSWKADGTRYLMFIRNKGEVFCIDRDNSVFKVRNLSFPVRGRLNIHLTNTLVDGEMVLDKVNGVTYPRFLIYDVVHVMARVIKDEPFFPNRYEVISKEVVEPRHEAMRRGMINKNHEPFSIRLKEFIDVQFAGKFLSEKFSRTLSHEPDGLIFQPSSEKYKVGCSEEVLKWKPESLNSVDFRLKIKMEGGVGIVPKKIGELYVGGMEHAFSKLSSVKNLLHLDNKIVECTFSDNKWLFLRERTDKSFPNSYDTAISVCNSIKKPVTKEILLDFIENNRYRDEMPPPMDPPLRHRGRF